MIKQLGPYEILEQIGAGAMGVVHRAVQHPLGRPVALKLLNLPAADADAASVRNRREMQLAASIAHPNLVRVFDGGTIDGVDYVAMELLSGYSLDALVADGAVPWRHALGIVGGIAAGLAHLHEQDILHRDIKPSNIFMSGGNEPKLLDFGLARRIDATLVTTDGAVIGTLLYMAPECARGEAASRASDLYSLGAVLYHMIAGVPPVDTASAARRGLTGKREPIPSPDRRDASIPEDVVALTLALLEWEPGRRLADAGELAERIGELLEAPAPAPLPGHTITDRVRMQAPGPDTATGMRAGAGPVSTSPGARPAVTGPRRAGTGPVSRRIVSNLGPSTASGHGAVPRRRAWPVAAAATVALALLVAPFAIPRLRRSRPAGSDGTDAAGLATPAAIVLALIEGRTDDASRICARRLASSPDDATALRLRGEAELAGHRLAEAGPTLASALKLAPGDPETLLALTRLALEKGDQARAEETAGTAVLAAPRSAAAHLALALCAQGRKDAGRFHAELAASGRGEARSPLVAMRQAELLAGSGEVGEASLALEYVANALPTASVPQIRLSELAFRDGRPAAAVTHARRAVQLDPGSVEATRALFVALADRGLIAEAVDALHDARKRMPGVAEWRERELRLGEYLWAWPHISPIPAVWVSRPAVSVFDRWRTCVPELPRLRAGGWHATTAQKALRRSTAVDLGDKPGDWIAWIELGRWIEDPHRPPLPPMVTPGERARLDPIQEMLFRGRLSDVIRRKGLDTVGAFTLALRSVLAWPADGRTWLHLACELERGDDEPGARLLYGVARSQLDGISLRNWSVGTWGCLVRALRMAPDGVLERRVPVLFPALGAGSEGYLALYTELARSDPDRAENLLSSIPQVGDMGAEAVLALANFRWLTRNDSPNATATLERACVTFPQAKNLQLKLFDFHMARGQLDKARVQVEQLPGDRWVRWFLQYTLEPPGTPPPEELLAWMRSTTDPDRDREVRRLLEIGDTAGAEAEVLSWKEKLGTAAIDVRVIAEMLGEGSRLPFLWPDLSHAFTIANPDPVYQPAIAPELARPRFSRALPDWDEMSRLAGSLATSAGAPVMTQLLEVARQAGGTPGTIARVRALWAGRRDALEESIDALEQAGRDDPSGLLPDAYVLEILSRPHWRAALGKHVDPGLLERTRRYPFEGSPLSREYWRALIEGDHAGASVLATRLLDQNAYKDGWIQIAAWAERARGAPPRPAVEAQLLRIARYRKLGLWVTRALAAIAAPDPSPR